MAIKTNTTEPKVIKAKHQYGYDDERINCLVIEYEGKTYSWIWFEDSDTPLNFVYEGDLSWTKFKNLPSRLGEGIEFPKWLNVHDFFDMYEDFSENEKYNEVDDTDRLAYFLRHLYMQEVTGEQIRQALIEADLQLTKEGSEQIKWQLNH